MDKDDGTAAVQYARSVITDEVLLTRRSCDIRLPPSFSEPSGVFVTINTYPTLALRGCIGYIEPVYSLQEALEYAARSACHDPRFLDLEGYELSDIVIDVTVLTPPRPIVVKDKEELLKAIKIGRDGLVIEYKGRKAVFLPQVPVDWGWNVTEYLQNLCEKAGLDNDAWKEKGCKVLSFRGRLFREISPDGEVEEVKEC